MAQGKEHKPTLAQRELVSEMSSNGINQEDIAHNIGIAVDCLMKYYKFELKNGRVNRVNLVGTNLFKTAMAGDVTAMIFFLKTQGRWKTEDYKQNMESNEDLKAEIKMFRATLDAKNRKEY